MENKEPKSVGRPRKEHVEKIKTAINSHRELEDAHLEFQRDPGGCHPDTYLEVTPEFFTALSRGAKTAYLTYGKPGIKIFIEGTRSKILESERMDPTFHRDAEIKAKHEALHK